MTRFRLLRLAVLECRLRTVLLLYFDKLNSVRPFLLQLRLNAPVFPVRTVCFRRSKL